MATTTMSDHKSRSDVDKPTVILDREGVTAKELKEAMELAPSPVPLLGDVDKRRRPPPAAS